jgi:hypothetical protein
MSKVYLSMKINDDGSLTIPAFAARGLGYEPGEEINLTLPVRHCLCDCEDNELFLSRCCGDAECGGYTSDGDELNIPARLLCEAGIPAGSGVSVLSAEGMLIIAAGGDGMQSDLTDELGCFMAELGYDPESVETSEAALPF